MIKSKSKTSRSSGSKGKKFKRGSDSQRVPFRLKPALCNFTSCDRISPNYQNHILALLDAEYVIFGTNHVLMTAIHPPKMALLGNLGQPKGLIWQLLSSASFANCKVGTSAEFGVFVHLDFVIWVGGAPPQLIDRSDRILCWRNICFVFAKGTFPNIRVLNYPQDILFDSLVIGECT